MQLDLFPSPTPSPVTEKIQERIDHPTPSTDKNPAPTKTPAQPQQTTLEIGTIVVSKKTGKMAIVVGINGDGSYLVHVDGAREPAVIRAHQVTIYSED